MDRFGIFAGRSAWLGTFLPLLISALTPIGAMAQWEPAFVLESPEPEPSGAFGYSVSGVPDVDGDGIWDIVVGAIGEDPGGSPKDAGRAHLFSGATGELLRTLSSPNEQSYGRFGYSVAGTADLNGDGAGDVAVGAWSEALVNGLHLGGQVHVFSGATGALIRTITSPDAIEDGRFGINLLSTPDLSGDGIADLLVASQSVSVEGVSHSGGWVHLLSGDTGEPLISYASPNEENGGGFGQALSVVPDVNGDDVPDVLIGARNETPEISLYGVGRAYLYSGATGHLIHDYRSPEEESDGRFGSSVSAFADIDGDSVCDLAIGAPNEETTGEPNSLGRVHVLSGSTGNLIRTLRPHYSIEGGNFGATLARVPDINGDGLDELAIAATLTGEVFLCAGGTAEKVVSHRSTSGGNFGSAMVGLADLNGDGAGDLAVGAPGQQASGITRAGRVHIFHSPRLPRFFPEVEVSNDLIDLGVQSIERPAAFSLTVTNRGTADLVFEGPGIRLEGGTFEDFAFSTAPDLSPLGPGQSRGVQMALFTEHTGFKEVDLVISTDDFDESEIRIPISAVATHPEALIPQIPPSSVFTIYEHNVSPNYESEYHLDITHGDINGDGYDDVIIGCPDTEAYSLEVGGAVSAVYGQPEMAGTNLSLRTEGAPMESETRFLIPSADAHLGWAVASGDINGDGIDDVVMGAPLEDPAAGIDAGKVLIVYGNAALPGEILIFAVAPGVFGETQIHGFQAGETLGSALTVGDFNADGFDDIAIGAPKSSPWGRQEAGRVYVIWGNADLPGQVLDLHDGLGGHGETLIGGDGISDNLGEELAAGDVDGDGLDDLIIGARMGDPLGRVDAGRAYIVYGNAMTPELDLDLRTAADSRAITHVLGDEVGGHTGESVACGDVNADGFDDLLIGAPLVDSESLVNAGELNVIWGAGNLHGAVLDLRNPSSQAVILGPGAGARAGISSGFADLSGDGHEDVIICNQYIRSDPDTVRILWGESIDLSERIDLQAPNARTSPFHAAYPSRVASLGGDVDRDGFEDFSYTGQFPYPFSYSVFGRGHARSATATEWFRAGQAPRRGIGGRLSPVHRTHISFDGGDGPTPVTVTLTRSSDGIANLDPGPLAGLVNATWEILTPRMGYSSAKVTLQYTDRELGTLIEDGLRLFQAPSPSGPWTEVAIQQLDTHRNEVMGVVGTMGHFAILGDWATGDTGMSSEGIVEHLLGLIPEAPGMDTNGDGRVDASDLVGNINDIRVD